MTRAWNTRNSKGSPSDRAHTPYRQQSAPSLSNNKGRVKPEEPAKSEEIRALEGLHNSIRTSTGRDSDPKGGCFCQAREHALSSHTPICRTCGLILCTINQPYYACPHCSSLLLTAALRVFLDERCAKLISDTLAREADERQRAIDEARRAAGAFPALPGAPVHAKNTGQQHPRPSNQTYKVMSLNSTTKRLTVSSYTSSTATPSRADAQTEAEEYRVPPPPAGVSYARSKPPQNRPWARLAGGTVTYISPSRSDGDEGCSKGSGKAKGKHKEKAADGGGKGSETAGERSEAAKPSG